MRVALRIFGPILKHSAFLEEIERENTVKHCKSSCHH